MDRSASNESRAYRYQTFDERGRPIDDDDTQRIAEELAHWMDAVFEIPGVGWRFGLDAIIGLIPFVGDAASTLVSIYIMGLASQAGVPRVTVARMAANVAIDMLVGSLPIVGDMFDVWWKANKKNAALLRERVLETPREARRATVDDWAFMAALAVGLLVLLAAVFAMFGFLLATGWRLAERVFG